MNKYVRIKARNPRYDSRHLYANGWIGPEFRYYTGTLVDVPWMGPNAVGLDDDGFLRVFSDYNIYEMVEL